MTDQDKETIAFNFMVSTRGQFIMAQALNLAIKELEKVAGPMREVSNIEDMKYLRDSVFPAFSSIAGN